MRVVFAILILSVAIIAAPGDLDTTFDTDGMVTTILGTDSDIANAVAIQSDGKIVVVGNSRVGSRNDMAIVRYNANGSLDTSFDTDGIKTINFHGSNTSSNVTGIFIRPNGKILLSGFAIAPSPENSDFALLQLSSDGSIDTTFGTNGKVTTDFSFGTFQDVANAMKVDSNGKIVLAGSVRATAANRDFAVARYNSDGTLDLTFSNDGKATVDFNGSNDTGSALVIDSSDNIYIAGNASSSTIDFGIVKFLSNGDLDTSFSVDGKLTVDMAGENDFFGGIAIDSNGKIVIAGGARVGDFDTCLIRLNTDGTLDNTFGTNGKVIQAFSTTSSDYARTLLIEADDKIFTGGTFLNPATSTFESVVARFNADGSVDNSFYGGGNSLWGNGGIAVANFGSSEIKALAFYPGGKIVSAGFGFGMGFDFAVARFDNLAPTAAAASISGKVSTGKLGRGIGNVIVHLTNQKGNIQTARTNQFGYFRFEDIEVGQTLVINAFHKRYQFNSQVINLDDSITNLIFTPQ